MTTTTPFEDQFNDLYRQLRERAEQWMEAHDLGAKWGDGLVNDLWNTILGRFRAEGYGNDARLGLPFYAMHRSHTVGCESVDREGHRNVTVQVHGWDQNNHDESGMSHLLMSPEAARDFGLALIEQAARAEAWTAMHPVEA